MKLFGEYLVEKEIISKDALVEALLEQMATTPSIAQIAYETKALSTDAILTIFKKQQELGTGFIESAKATGFWQESIAQGVSKSLVAKRIPLGQILVKSGRADLAKISHALDEYLGECQGEKDEIPAASAHNPAATSDFSLFCDLFTTELLQDLELRAAELSPEHALKAKAATERLLGAAKLVNATILETRLAQLAAIYDELSKKDEKTLPADLKQKIELTLASGIRAICSLQEKLKSGDRSVLQDELKDLDTNFEVLKFDIEVA